LDEGDAQVPNQDGTVDLEACPTTTRLQALLSEDHSVEEFEISLETLLNRLEMDISQ
jgi:TetR/AcrR family transcriptional regulator, tetracycline repressor protein